MKIQWMLEGRQRCTMSFLSCSHDKLTKKIFAKTDLTNELRDDLRWTDDQLINTERFVEFLLPLADQAQSKIAGLSLCKQF